MPDHVKRQSYNFCLGRAVHRLKHEELAKLAAAHLSLANDGLRGGEPKKAQARILAAQELIQELRDRGEQLSLTDALGGG